MLQVLLAPNNAIADLDCRLLARWPLLRRLDVSGNRLASVPVLPPMLHLESIELSDNQISELAPLLPAALPQLRRLNASFNAIERLGCVCCAAGLPGLASLQLHDNPVAGAAGYALEVARAVPWLVELDRAPLQQHLRHRQTAGQAAAAVAEAGEAAQPQAAAAQLQDDSSRDYEHTASAAAGSSRVALLLIHKLRASPGVCMGIDHRQHCTTVQHWLPALMAADDVEEDSCAADPWQSQWDHSTVIGLAEQQAVQRVALSTLKPAARLAACRYEGTPAGRICSTVAAGPTAQPAGPAWLSAWEAESGERLADSCVGSCAELAAAAEDIGTPAAWLQAQERQEQRVLWMAQRHLQQLIAPPSMQQQVLHAQPAFARRVAALKSMVEATAASTVLQSAWRGKVQRARLAAERWAALAAAAVALQSSWRGRAVRAGGEIQRLRSAAAARRAAAATALQAAWRGRRVRRRLAEALAAAGRGAGGGGCIYEEDSFSGVTGDFLQLSPGLEAELLGLGGSGFAAGPFVAPVAASASGPAASSPAAEAQVDAAATVKGSLADTASGTCGRGGRSGSRSGSGSDDGGSNGTDGGDDDQADGGSVQICESSVDDAGGRSQQARAARLELKLRALMQEWGFTDLATAKAYYKRQQRVLQAQHRHAAEARMRDPQARLRRLQRQVGSSIAAAARPAAAPSPPSGGRMLPVLAAEARRGGKREQQQQQSVAAGSGGRVPQLPPLGGSTSTQQQRLRG